MPRRAPDGVGVTEHRITFGTYERQFVTEVKNDIEKSVKVAAVTAVAAPALLGASIAGGLGLLGYGIYRGMDAFGFGNDIVETLGCTARKYLRASQIFGWHPFAFVNSCEVAATYAERTPYDPNAPPASQYGGGSPRGGGEFDYEAIYGENAGDRERGSGRNGSSRGGGSTRSGDENQYDGNARNRESTRGQ